MSEQAASYVQFALDTVSVGKAGMSLPVKAKPVYTDGRVSSAGKTPAVTTGTPTNSGGAANATTGAKLADNLAAAQARDPRIGMTLPGAKAPITVTAEGSVGGRTIVDTNQTARPVALADANKPTLISDLLPPGKPNSNMANAHAEVSVIQRAYDAGLTKGQNMTIVVRGEAVCSFCLDSRNLVAAADRAGLNRLEVVDTYTRSTYIWNRGSNGLVKK